MLAAGSMLSSEAALTAHWNFFGGFEDQDLVSGTTGDLLDGATVSDGNLNLVGGSSRIDTNTNGGLGGTGSFTIYATFATSSATSSATNQTIFDFSPTTGGTSGADIRLFAQGNGNIRIEMSAGSGFEVSLPVSLVDGNSHTIAAVFDSSTGDSFQDVDLYVDGVFYDVTGGVDGTVNLLGGRDVFIGSIGHLTIERPFNGTIEEVAIFDEAIDLPTLNAYSAGTLTIPEPSSVALLGLGGLALCLRRRK